MALESTQPLPEMSSRNLPGGKGRPAREADITAICGSSRPVIGAALPFPLRIIRNIQRKSVGKMQLFNVHGGGSYS
jgi:hypothetical protein